MAWNASFTIPFLAGLLGFLAKFLLIGVVGWYLMLQLLLSDSVQSEPTTDHDDAAIEDGKITPENNDNEETSTY